MSLRIANGIESGTMTFPGADRRSIARRSPCRIANAIRTVVAVLFIGWLAVCAHAQEQLLFDFETSPLSKDWAAFREISVSRSPIPAPPPPSGDDRDRLPPSEYGVHVETTGQAGMVCSAGELPTDWRRFRALSLWVYRDPKAAREHAMSTFEVRLYDAENKVTFWRRIAVTHQGWQRVEVPLRWMRWGDERVPRWDEVARLGFWFRDATDLWIDSVALVRGKDDHAANIDVRDLYEVGFAGIDPAKIVAIQSDDYLVASNAEELDSQRLARHLDEVVAAVRRDLPMIARQTERATLLIFATPQEYQAFTPRLAQKLSGVAPRPTSDGYTTQGIATSYWDPELGTLRPVFTHEFVHSLVAQGARLPNAQEWFHEGYATLVQRRFHPQAKLPELVRKGLADESSRLPLARLCDGKPIPINAYWQAMTVVELLLTNPKYSAHVPELVQRFVVTGSTDLGPHLSDLLKTDWQTLTDDWVEHCLATYPAEEATSSK